MNKHVLNGLIVFAVVSVTTLATEFAFFRGHPEMASARAITWGFLVVLGAMEIFILIQIDTMKQFRKLPEDIARDVRVQMHAGILGAPGMIAGGYDDVVRTIFNLEDHDIQTELISFTSESLRHIRHTNGFPLTEQHFESYRDKAKAFCAAARHTLDMTCMYCPVEYLLKLYLPGHLDPDHLLVFNTAGGNALRRQRVMCADEALVSNLTAFPHVFPAALLWFLYLSCNFAELRWSSKRVEDDIIIIDKRFMWRYVPKKATLYLKCAWSEEPDGATLTEWGTWFSGDEMATFHDCLRIHLLYIAPDGDLWTKFRTGLSEYLHEALQVAQGAVPSIPAQHLKSFQAFAQCAADAVDTRHDRLQLLQMIKEYRTAHRGRGGKGNANLDEFFGDFGRKMFTALLAHIYTSELQSAEHSVKIRP